MRLTAGPAAAAFIALVHFAVRGLPPTGVVTVQARTRDYEGRLWESGATFRATKAGT
jgi:hypothetical protein